MARALDVLDAFCRNEELSLAELSQRVGLNKSRVFRLVSTLVEKNYLERMENGYALGVKLLTLAACVRSGLKQVALPVMQQLNSTLNETVNLGVIDGSEVMYIEIIESAQSLRIAMKTGKRSAIHASSLGKALMAYASETDLSGWLNSHALKRSTDRTLTEVEEIQRQLKQIRARGYAVDNQEDVMGAACFGAPVFDARKNAVAAISVSGPAQRIHSNQAQIIAALLASAREISRRLGFSGDSLA